MKHHAIAFLVVAIGFVAGAQTQEEIDKIEERNHPEIFYASKSYEKTHQLMNEAYGLLLKLYGGNPDEGNDQEPDPAGKLKASQKAWEKYRDAEEAAETAFCMMGSDANHTMYYVANESLEWERLERLKFMIEDFDEIHLTELKSAGEVKKIKPEIEKVMNKIKKMESERKSR